MAPTQRDLLVAPSYAATTWTTLDLVASTSDGGTDLAVAAEGNALRQALLLRLLTPLGSMAELGHAEYGSRLHELIGTPNVAAAGPLARKFVIQAVEQERRATLLDLRIEPAEPSAPDTLRIFLRVQPTSGLDPVALGIEVSL